MKQKIKQFFLWLPLVLIGGLLIIGLVYVLKENFLGTSISIGFVVFSYAIAIVMPEIIEELSRPTKITLGIIISLSLTGIGVLYLQEKFLVLIGCTLGLLMIRKVLLVIGKNIQAINAKIKEANPKIKQWLKNIFLLIGIMTRENIFKRNFTHSKETEMKWDVKELFKIVNKSELKYKIHGIVAVVYILFLTLFFNILDNKILHNSSFWWISILFLGIFVLIGFIHTLLDTISWHGVKNGLLKFFVYYPLVLGICLFLHGRVTEITIDGEIIEPEENDKIPVSDVGKLILLMYGLFIFYRAITFFVWWGERKQVINCLKKTIIELYQFLTKSYNSKKEIIKNIEEFHQKLQHCPLPTIDTLVKKEIAKFYLRIFEFSERLKEIMETSDKRFIKNKNGVLTIVYGDEEYSLGYLCEPYVKEIKENIKKLMKTYRISKYDIDIPMVNFE
ncbi:MAG: hypothetical protein NC922_06860 [Candidatus Omnitrophica bacterium]|nr:hypothetical protein [Candidatus Omnitrophota bacterium]